MRNLSREDRDAFNRAKQKEWTSWLDKEAVELVIGQRKFRKLGCAHLVFQDPRLTTLPTSSPTLTSDGESAMLQWIVNEGHLWKVRSEDGFPEW